MKSGTAKEIPRGDVDNESQCQDQMGSEGLYLTEEFNSGIMRENPEIELPVPSETPRFGAIGCILVDIAVNLTVRKN